MFVVGNRMLLIYLDLVRQEKTQLIIISENVFIVILLCILRNMCGNVSQTKSLVMLHCHE